MSRRTTSTSKTGRRNKSWLRYRGCQRKRRYHSHGEALVGLKQARRPELTDCWPDVQYLAAREVIETQTECCGAVGANRRELWRD